MIDNTNQSQSTESANPKGEFFRFTITRPVAILMIVLGVSVFGFISYKQLSLNLMPDISYPSLTVRTEYPGSAPEEVETTITRPVEEALGVVGKLTRISSVSKAERSDVILEYDWDTDMNQATAEVREKLDQVFLPDETKRPLILRYDPTLDPIIRYGLYGSENLADLRNIAETSIKRKLETVSGVAAVKVKGGLEEEIRVELNEQQLTLIGINIEQIRQRLTQENINLAGGNLKEGQTEYVVRTLNEFKSVDEIGDVVIGSWNNKEIRVKDVARVTRTTKDREVVTRINSQESVEIEIFKEADANIVAVSKTVNQIIFGTLQQQQFVQNLKNPPPKKEEPKKDDKDTAKKEDKKKQGPPPGMADMQRERMTDFIAYQLPEGLKIEKLSDQSIFIESSLKSVKDTAVMGGILAVIILFIFLRRLVPTLIIGISIPISIVATFVPMRLFDVSLNIMSLGGLALGIGMLVDNSIVVLESITRCREEGDDLFSAITRGISEVASAVNASTLTTVAVFFPIVFVEGIAGQVFGDLALAVVFSLLASLVVALFVIPMLTAREDILSAFQTQGTGNPVSLKRFNSFSQLKGDYLKIRHWRFDTIWRKAFSFFIIFVCLFDLIKFLLFLILELVLKILHVLVIIFLLVIKFSYQFVIKFVKPISDWALDNINFLYDKVAGYYPIILKFALHNHWMVISLTLMLFFFTVFVPGKRLGSELIPVVHQGEFNVEITLPVGTPIETTYQRVMPVEEYIKSQPEVTTVATVIGTDKTSTASSEEGENFSKITVNMIHSGNIVESEEILIDQIRAKLKEFSGITTKFSRPVLFSFKTPIEVELQGYDLVKLQQYGQKIAERMSAINGIFDVKSSMQQGNPEVQIIYDRQMLSRAGLNVNSVAGIIRTKILGDIATEFKEEDRKIDIRVRLREEDKKSIEDLRRLIINPGSPRPITLESVAEIRLSEGPSEIRRVEQQRTCLITANVKGRDLQGVSQEIYRALRDVDLPYDFSFNVAGQNKEMETSKRSLMLALILAIFLVYIVMASQFESLIHPLVILFTIPLALIGVVWVLYLKSIPVSIVVFLGMIVLVGIVVNNAIVLVDYINQLRTRGMKKLDATIEAGKARLRPIAMTTLTTILGLFPMALGFGDGTEIRTPMAITIIVGLTSSALLTLVVIPTVYYVIDRKKD